MTPEAKPGNVNAQGGLEDLLERLKGRINIERLRGTADNRRRHRRRGARLLLEFRRAGSENSLSGRVIDISIGGMRCLVDEELEPGALLALTIKSPDTGALDGRIDGYGEVLRCRHRGDAVEIGIVFVRPQAAGSPGRALRIDVAFDLFIRPGDGRRLLGVVEGITASGLSFHSPEALSVGEEVALSFCPRRAPGFEGILSSVAVIVAVTANGDGYDVTAGLIG